MTVLLRVEFKSRPLDPIRDGLRATAHSTWVSPEALSF